MTTDLAAAKRLARYWQDTMYEDRRRGRDDLAAESQARYEAADRRVRDLLSNDIKPERTMTMTMTTNPLETRLTRYAAGLAAQGRTAAAELRAAAAAGHPTDDYQVRLAAAERHLADLLLTMTPAHDAPHAPLNLAAYAHGRAQPRNVAKGWARAACRGYSWQELTAPLAGRADLVDRAAEAIEAAGIEPERIVWAPGLTLGEARAVCGSLGLDQPEPLADIDAILTERVTADADGDW